MFETLNFFFTLKSWLLSLSGITVCLLSPWLGLGQISNKGSKGLLLWWCKPHLLCSHVFQGKELDHVLIFDDLTGKIPPCWVCLCSPLSHVLSLSHSHVRARARRHTRKLLNYLQTGWYSFMDHAGILWLWQGTQVVFSPFTTNTLLVLFLTLVCFLFL